MAARWTMAGRQLLLLLLLSAVQAKVVDGFDWVIGGADGDVWMRFKTIWETRSTALGDEGGEISVAGNENNQGHYSFPCPHSSMAVFMLHGSHMNWERDWNVGGVGDSQMGPPLACAKCPCTQSSFQNEELG